MFELFPPLFNSKKIEQWTANEFWKHLKLSKKERNRFNRQRMYRLLRKLVEDGFLTKETNLVNPRLSTFSETNKLDQLREITGISLDFILYIPLILVHQLQLWVVHLFHFKTCHFKFLTFKTAS